MIIPLTHRNEYKVFNLIPHPINISENALVLPDMNNIILKDKDKTYIITQKENLYTISPTLHVLLKVEPIYSQSKPTCEWSAFNKDIDSMLMLCNYRKAGVVNDVFVIETEEVRLAYFTNHTQVELNCPGQKLKQDMKGLHKIPTSCDITTDQVHWPSKQTTEIEILPDEIDSINFESIKLPTIALNKTSVVHESLRDLINKLPNKNDPMTIDFQNYGISLEEAQSYSIYMHTGITTMVIINSILIGFLLLKWFHNKTHHEFDDNDHRFGESFRRKYHNLRDSIRTKKDKISRENLNKFKGSIRSRSSSLKRKIHNTLSNAHNFPQVYKNIPAKNDVGTNTELEVRYGTPKVYPGLPRYA